MSQASSTEARGCIITVSTQASTTTLGGNGVTTAFGFSFIGVSSSDIQVTFTDADGTATILTPFLQYTLILNPAAPGQLWGVGGTVTYPISGDPIPSGTTLTISRILPLTQTVSISNQGDFYPTVTETALDTLEMQIQQVSSRTTQFRGTWQTNTDYNVGDIVQDGANGNNTLNYYICAIQNLSDVWSTDLAAGYWAFSAAAAPPSATVFIATSTSSNTIGTGSKTFTTQSGKEFQAGQFILVSSAANSANYMFGQVTSYSATTLVIDVQSVGGSGTHTDWNISVSGTAGATGSGFNGGIITGDLTLSGCNLNQALGSSVASASTVDLRATAVDGDTFYILGTTTINAILLEPGARRLIKFSDSLQLTYSNPALILPTNANLTTLFGDYCEVVGIDSGASIFNYTRSSGLPLAEANNGQVVQIASFETGAVATGTTTMPFDDTIPQKTEGDQYMSLAITPTSATHKLLIQITALVSHSADNVIMNAGLFQDTITNAVAASTSGLIANSKIYPLVLTHIMLAGTTSATTFKLRMGSSTAGTSTFNGLTGSRIFGGVMASSITITEYVP